jgi:HEAT repeat protein
MMHGSMTRPAFSVLCLLLATSLQAGLRSQEWTDEQLMAEAKGFDSEDYLERQKQVAALLPRQQLARSAVATRIHGDHREYMLKVERLLGELTDARWTQREQAERSLIEIGARAQATIAQRAEKGAVLEERMRCRRILDAIRSRGTADEERQLRYLRGFVALAERMDGDPKLVRSLRSALGHTDASVVDGALRALGTHGGDEEADAVAELIAWKGGIHRARCVESLARMRSARAVERLAALAREGSLSRAEQCVALAACRGRADAAPLLAELRKSKQAAVFLGARMQLPETTADGPSVSVAVPGGHEPLRGTFAGFDGEAALVRGVFDGMPVARIEFADANVLEFPDAVAKPGDKARFFLTQGSLVTGDLVGCDETTVRIRSSTFGDLTIPLASLQGIALDPQLDRLVGSSSECDRVRLKSGEFVDGKLETIDANGISLATAQGPRTIARTEAAGVMTRKPRTTEVDNATYARVELVDGDRLLGLVVGSTRADLAFVAPGLKEVILPMRSVSRIEFGVGGGAMWGFTIIADYSDNKILEVDDQGRVTFELEDIFGAADVECLDNNNLLVTEFSVSRISEVNRKGETVWVYDDKKLKNPFDADRLENGNTLIADAYGARVIEVSPDKKIVWTYDKEVRPFDCDRLPNGNTLICDVLKDRVIEVTQKGEIVWEAKGMNSAHDADRLPNGNTLVTLRSKGSVLELDRDGKVVWELTGLVSPSDADRLPNGNTVVAEKDLVREFDRRKNVVWKKEVNWAIEANRY